MEININKYWIGYLTGILICINLISVGVIFSYTLSWDLKPFFLIWLISLLPLLFVYYFKEKQLKKEKNYGN